jgi:hypothetical protein
VRFTLNLEETPYEMPLFVPFARAAISSRRKR